MSDALSYLVAAGKGAAAGAALGPIGAAVGGLAGLASSLVPHIFGQDATPILQAAAQAITGAPDEAAQMQILSTDSAALAAFKVQALQIAKDREQAQLDAQTNDIADRLGDVADARQQTIDLAKSGSSISWGAPLVSAIVLVTFGAVMLFALYRTVPPNAEPVLNVMLGTLSAMATAVVQYWVGSSIGSARKDDRLASLQPHPSQPSVVVPESKVKAA